MTVTYKDLIELIDSTVQDLPMLGGVQDYSICEFFKHTPEEVAEWATATRKKHCDKLKREIKSCVPFEYRGDYEKPKLSTNCSDGDFED
jgi:hypothetical protein